MKTGKSKSNYIYDAMNIVEGLMLCHASMYVKEKRFKFQVWSGMRSHVTYEIYMNCSHLVKCRIHASGIEREQWQSKMTLI